MSASVADSSIKVELIGGPALSRIDILIKKVTDEAGLPFAKQMPAEFRGSRFSTNKKPAPHTMVGRAGKHFSYHLLGGCANITSFRFARDDIMC